MRLSPFRRFRVVRSIGWATVFLAISAFAATLLFPSLHCDPEPATRTQAKNDVTQIAIAITAFASEYGRLPTSSLIDVTLTDDAQSHLLDVLCPPDPQTPPAENSLGIVFLEVPIARAGRNGRVKGTGPYRDPWGQTYFVRLDADHDGMVRAPEDGKRMASEIHKRVIVWSRGDPRQTSPGKAPRWITSWE